MNFNQGYLPAWLNGNVVVKATGSIPDFAVGFFFRGELFHECKALGIFGATKSITFGEKIQ